MAGLFDPNMVHILDQGKPRRFFEGPAKVGGTYIEPVGEILQCQALIIMVINEMGDMGDSLMYPVG